MRTNTASKCYFCGKEERLRFFEVAFWVCDKDYEKLGKFMKRLKKSRSRSHSIESFIKRHNLEAYR